MKTCSKCKIDQMLSNYHRDSTKKDGLCSVCKICKRNQVSKYHYDNRALCNEKKKARYQENKNEINAKRRKHPSIEGRGVFNKLNPHHFDFGASLRKPKGVSSFNRLIRQYKKQASSRGLEFCLNDECFKNLVTGNCYYCGLMPNQIMENRDCNGAFIYNGIDRIDNTTGYVDGNCVSCCKICNRAKSNLSDKMWRDWINRLIAYHTNPAKLMD